ncbi:MAG TPA: hypothetical protein VKW77_08050, partial [Acidimicrobiales bacterium]|nr:hypothetical protein [Acidimicrobiales bacterium]
EQAVVAPGEEDRSAALEAAVRTLDGMAAGGIHDHLGGGFSRYSTDVRWLVPHFEKMLYDQAGLLRTYLHGWLATGNPSYLWVAERIVGYVARDLTGPEGGVFSAEDADSEGEEGRFYVWTPEEVAAAVSAAAPGERERLAAAAVDFFSMAAGPNFEGRSILHRPPGQPLVGPTEVEMARRLLFEARSRRPRPGLDDKVLTEWNAMYASALAEAAGATGRRDWAEGAEAIGEFLLGHLRGEDGRWLRSWQAGAGARHLAYAGDYAWLVDAFTRLGELTGRWRWTAAAVEAADELLSLFHDDEGGGFHATGRDAEALLVRPKEILDGAVPSANGVAALALARLAAVTGSGRYAETAEEIVALVAPLLEQHPTAVAYSAIAAELLAAGVVEVVVPGDGPAASEMVSAVRRQWRPSVVLAWGEPTGGPLWQGREAGAAYVCRQSRCELPARDLDTLSRQLAEAAAATPAPPPVP